MVLAPTESSQGLPGRRHFRSWRWRDCFEGGCRAKSMSQERAVSASAVPLEELSGWPEELCRRELPTVLPRLLISFAVALHPPSPPREESAAGVASFSSAGPPPPPGRVAFARPETSRFFVVERDGAARGRRAGGDRLPGSQGMPGFGTARARRGVLCPSMVEVGVAFSSIAPGRGVFLCSPRLLDRSVGEPGART